MTKARTNEERLRDLELDQNSLVAELATLTEGTDEYKSVEQQIASLQDSLNAVYTVMFEAQ